MTNSLLLLIMAVLAASVAVIAAWSVARLVDHKQGRMTAAEAESYKGSIQRAEIAHQAAKAHHDRTGSHVWLDVTAYGSPAKYQCIYCDECRNERWMPTTTVNLVMPDGEVLLKQIAKARHRVQH